MPVLILDSIATMWQEVTNMGTRNHYSSRGRTNADGTTALKHEIKDRKYEPEYKKDILEDMRMFWAAMKAWEGGDLKAHRKAGSCMSRMNGAFWKLHVDNIWSGSKGAAYATKQAIYEAWQKAVADGNTKTASELLEVYISRLNATECQKFLLEAITNKDMEQVVKERVMTLITDRVQELQVKKAEKKA